MFTSLSRLRSASLPPLGAFKGSDLLLAFFIVAIVGLMILPMPTAVLDALVAANIAVGVMLVLMAIYVSSALQFSAFPSVLLISTLFRLALSVATTRMILLHGDAGNIINTFGSLVAGGNIVVGLVVFLIITLVQFLVIAKGSERVAEVGARFTLDAMPGKQLSIDSDLRSGLMDKDDARRKRRDLEQESQLHGSLDGAMKFVKGDAIAGIIIIIINLLGGLAIGVFQLDMDAGAAIAKYSILTIGDGMVAQIPALFGAMAAGLIVTRVGDSDSTEHLGDAIGQQFAAIPRVSLVAGAMCLLFAFVPGFPSTVFALLGIALVFTGSMLVPAVRIFVRSWSQPAFATVLQNKDRPLKSHVDKTRSVTIHQSYTLSMELPIVASAQGADRVIQQRMEEALQRHHEQSGIELPSMQFLWHRDERPHWALNAFDVPIVSGELGADVDHDALVAEAVGALRRNIKLFVGIQETSRLLARVSNAFPEVVKEIQRVIPLQGIAVIIRNLVEEEVPIRNFHTALDGLVQASQHDKDLVNLTEYARMALGRQICHRYAQGRVLRAVGLSIDLEQRLLDAVRTSNGVQEFVVEPVVLAALRSRLVRAIDEWDGVVVVAPIVLRRHVRALLVEVRFDTPVMSYPEFTKPFELVIVERVSLDADAIVKAAT